MISAPARVRLRRKEDGAMDDPCIDWRARAVAAEAMLARMELLVYSDRPTVQNPNGTTWRDRAIRAEEEAQKCRNVLPMHISRILYAGEG